MNTPIIDIEFDILSEEHIRRAEDAINSDLLQPIENNYMLSISYQHYNLAELGYKKMIKHNTPNTSYFIFGGNAYGMQSYGLYKALDSKIYIIDSYMGQIQKIFIPHQNIDCFRNIIEN